MLTLLRISNYAIIDDVEIEFGAGFSVMTGETGAGKSILVDAIGLALGDRADASSVRHGANRAEISLVFELDADHPAQAWLAERGLDDDLCCLRRTVSAEGRSRAFVNNQPVTLADLRAIGGQLVDIHGQHAHQSLLKPGAQRGILDAHAGLKSAAREVALAYAELQALRREREAFSGDGANRETEIELTRFQLGELEALALSEGEPEQLARESARLRHVDQLRRAIGEAAELSYLADSDSAHALAARARRLLETVVAHDPELESLIERITGAEIELREAGMDLSRRLDRMDDDPARLEEVETRLDRIHQLARRHGVRSEEVPAVEQRLRERLASLDASAESAAELDARNLAAEQRFDSLAESLSTARRKAASGLAEAVTAKLRELGLPDARFEVQVQPRSDGRRGSSGIDQVLFSVTTNAGQPPGAIDRVASGGELSRIGLALAVVATDASPIPALIFDEVDAGIGGAVAEVVGRRLKQIAASHQVLCVTHLPQVASQGHSHFRIVKLSDGRTSRTQVRALNEQERIEELSRMLGGVEITAATRAHAEEMIRQAAGS